MTDEETQEVRTLGVVVWFQADREETLWEW